MSDWTELRRFFDESGLQVHESQFKLLEDFAEDLYRTNQHINLTRIMKDEFAIRHVIDSLLFVDQFPEGAKVLDLGCGAGFPSWPLAWARPDLQVIGLDSHQKPLEFLSRHPLPNLRLHLGRAEENHFKETADVVTGRAFAPLSIQLEMSAPAAVVGGTLVLLRTPKDIELSAPWDVGKLGLAGAEAVQRALPNGIADRAALIYRKSAKTPDRFPRSWAEAKKKPMFSAPQD